MVHDPEPADPEDGFPEDWDDDDPDLIGAADFDPYDDLDEAEQDLINEMREAGEWIVPEWLDEEATRDQPDG